MSDEQDLRLDSNTNIRSALLKVSVFLKAKQARDPRRDAELLLCHLLSKDRAFILSHPELVLTDDHLNRLADLALLRGQHYPLQYITGVQEFYGREFLTTSSTLIPRPETELLIDSCLWLSTRFASPVEILDVGTGTGCLALTLLLELPGSRAVATDISCKALNVARSNALRLGCQDRFFLVNCDLLPPFPVGIRPYHLIVSNPPYVSSTAADVERAVWEYEPQEAVFAGPSGLEVYGRLLEAAPALLAPDGFLVLELGAGQRSSVSAEAARKGWEELAVRKDLAGHERCVIFRLASPSERSSFKPSVKSPGPGRAY